MDICKINKSSVDSDTTCLVNPGKATCIWLVFADRVQYFLSSATLHLREPFLSDYAFLKLVMVLLLERTSSRAHKPTL